MDIPKRSVYRASEVCEIARIQPYVLRSWESEFPNLGVPRTSGGRVYRRSDVEQVLRIKQLVFEEGLTLGGARRRLEEEASPQPALPLEELVASDVKTRVANVRQGLQDLLSLLGGATAPRDAAGGGNGDRPAAPEMPLKAEGGATPKRGRRARAKPGTNAEHGIVGPDDHEP